MTYDNSAELRCMSINHDFDYEAIPMKNTHNAKMNELLVSKDLTWVRTLRR